MVTESYLVCRCIHLWNVCESHNTNLFRKTGDIQQSIQVSAVCEIFRMINFLKNWKKKILGLMEIKLYDKIQCHKFIIIINIYAWLYMPQIPQGYWEGSPTCMSVNIYQKENWSLQHITCYIYPFWGLTINDYFVYDLSTKFPATKVHHLNQVT